MVVAVRWRRVVVGAVVILSTTEATWRVVGVVVRVRGKVWRWIRAEMAR